MLRKIHNYGNRRYLFKKIYVGTFDVLIINVLIMELVVMKELWRNLKFAWSYAKGQKKYIFIILFTSICSIIFSILTPILSAKIIISLTSNNFIQIILTALAICVVDGLSSFMRYLSRRSAIKVYRNTLSVLEIDLGRNVLKLENECLDKNGSGVFIQRLTNDTSRIADVFQAVLGMTSELIKYIGILIAIFIVNKLVFIYIFIILILLYILENKRTKQRNADDKISRKANEKVAGFIGELVRGARDIKMLNSEEDFLGELSNKIDDANYKRMKMQRISWNYKLVMWEITGVFEFILIVLLVIFMQQGIMLPTIALVLYNYCNSVYNSVYLIGDLLEYIKDFNLSSERIYSIINNDEFKKEEFGTRHLDKINGDFEFKDVTFSYKDKKVLNKLNFKINANETVAFVGKSGAGKSTIFSLLCKMYNVNSGKITLDGVDINELDKDSIRGNITIISQNPYIFNMSIRENLKLVKSDLTDKEMKDACKIACLDSFIRELPDGYDTIIGEGGVNLSGGQKQRLAIARALVQKTEIILFDEATSALDNETQEKIQQAIDNMKNEYTILIIAHRLSTIINSDRILYLDNGKIEAEGTHDYLLKNCEKYKKLYESEITKDNGDN